MMLTRTDKNLVYALPPFPTAPGCEGLPCQVALLADPGARPSLPFANAFRIRRQFMPWQAPDTDVRDVTLQLTPALDLTSGGLYVHGVNYPEIALFRSTDNITWERAEPNLLYKSHRPRDPITTSGAPTAPWAATGSVVCTAAGDRAPRPEIPCQQLDMGAGSYLEQDVTLALNAGGRAFSAGVWLRGVGSAPAMTVSLRTGSVVSRAVTVEPYWQLFLVATAAMPGSGTTLTLRVENGGTPASVLFGGAFLAPDTAAVPLFDYETGANGLIVPVHDGTQRRKAFIHQPGFNFAYWRMRIPAGQTTDDGRGWYSTPTLVLIPTAKAIGGLHLFPQTIGVDVTVDEVVLEGRARETPARSPLQALLSVRGTYDGVRSEADFLAIERTARTQQILIVENTVRPGGIAADPSRAHLMQLTTLSPRQYQIPHLLDADLSLVEAW